MPSPLLYRILVRRTSLMARSRNEKRRLRRPREADFSMIENIPLDHVEIAHLRLRRFRKKRKAAPADIVSSGARGMKAAIRGAVGVCLTFLLGYVLLTLVR